jgi:hypothetical protein
MRAAACLVAAYLGAAVCLGGCAGKSRDEAQAATERFRARYVRGAYAEIYGRAAPELRASATEAQFVKLMERTSQKLGSWQSAESVGWRVNVGTAGRIVMLGFKSQFEKGVASEEFLWRIQEPEPALAGYHINSPLFLDD